LASDELIFGDLACVAWRGDDLTVDRRRRQLWATKAADVPRVKNSLARNMRLRATVLPV